MAFQVVTLFQTVGMKYPEDTFQPFARRSAGTFIFSQQVKIFVNPFMCNLWHQICLQFNLGQDWTTCDVSSRWINLTGSCLWITITFLQPCVSRGFTGCCNSVMPCNKITQSYVNMFILKRLMVKGLMLSFVLWIGNHQGLYAWMYIQAHAHVSFCSLPVQ